MGALHTPAVGPMSRFPLSRIWDRYTVTETGCWEYSGDRLPTGYGRLMQDGRILLAHRVAWALTHGEIADGLYVCHKCDNPPCMNPAHLFLGDVRENNRDRTLKGREHNTRKTHCIRGHEFTPENTMPVGAKANGEPRRVCRTCDNSRHRAERERRTRTRNGPVTCPECGAGFESDGGLRVHRGRRRH